MSTRELSPESVEEAAAMEREVRLHHRYEWAHIANDALISAWFLVGSVFFLYPDLQKQGTWLFVIGSTQMFLGPVIRTFNKLQVKTIVKQNLHF